MFVSHRSRGLARSASDWRLEENGTFFELS
eukprot:COSAG06_NODE_3527_length_5227_cov_8.315523_5_plen_29_part_01